MLSGNSLPRRGQGALEKLARRGSPAEALG